MPRIFLKPQSPEFSDPAPAPKIRHCDMPDCAETGEHKAPKDRGLQDHYWFCLDHIKEYNKAWNFFEGLSPREIEEHMLKSLYGDRPTWQYGVNGDSEEALYRKAWQTMHDTEQAPPRSKREDKARRSLDAHRNTPEVEALGIMELEPPVVLADIKAQYKILVKKHHPDLNGGCLKSEEHLKKINMAYTILKLAYEKFEKLGG